MNIELPCLRVLFGGMGSVQKTSSKMTPEEFKTFEIQRLQSFIQWIEVSLTINPDVDELQRQEIMEVVNRTFDAEMEFAQDEPEEYMELYYKN